jgi:transcriptional regulator with XRE-family HTH domain
MPLSRSRTLTRLPLRSSADIPSTVRPRSPSIDILKRSLEIAGVSRKQFVQATGLSYEYVSRIFNAKVKFPTVRETLEKFAEVAEIDPMMFPEYQQLVAVLPESTRRLWNRMQELGFTRQEFASKVDISRTYMYEILRGDVPFPRNPEVIEKIAYALDIPPEVFGEYLAPVVDWAERNPQAIEHVFLNMLVSKMMVDRGYVRKDDTTAHLLSDELLAVFPPDDRYEPMTRRVLQAMGKRKLDIRRLAAEADIDERDLRLLLMGQLSPEDLPDMMKMVRAALKIR